MKTFQKWCEERKLELPTFTETPPAEETKDESGGTKRSSVRSHAYPPLYARGQYPAQYFAPIAADNLAYNKDV
jgi:hypothetical protein